MTDESLRMQATVVDKATGPLKEIQRGLRDVSRSGNFSNLRKEFEGLNRATQAIGREMKTVMLPALGAIGLTSAGLVASIVGVTKALKGFSEGALDLHHLGRETNLVVVEMKAFEFAAERMRIAPEAAQQGLRAFANVLVDLKNRLPGVRDELSQAGAGGLAMELEQLGRQGRNFDAVKRALQGIEAVRKTRGVGEARRLSQLLFGNPDMERVTIENIAESMAKVGHATEEDRKKAQAFQDNMVSLRHVLNNLKVAIGNDLLPTLSNMIGEFERFVEGEGGKEFKKTIVAIGESLKDIDWRSIGEGVGIVGGEIAAVMRDLAQFTKDLRALTTGEWKPEPGSIAEGVVGARDALRGAVRGREQEVLGERRNRLGDRRGSLADIDGRMSQLDKESAAYKRLAERRETVIREIESLEEGIKKLEKSLEDAGNAAKRMNFFAPGGGGPIVVPASLTTGGGGGGGGNFRPGFRGSGMGAAIQQGLTLGGGSGGGSAGGSSGGGASSDAPGPPATAGGRQRFATAVPGVSGSPPGGRLDGPSRLHDLTSVPTPVLDQAKALLNRGGGAGELQRFMAAQGYPKSGNWCGEFAASVVRAAGGTPPKGAAVASNWMNWGEHVDAANAKPGDIAVRKRSRFGGMAVPGRTGSHVGLVDSVDPRSGRFNLLGGNQSRPVVPHGLGEYEFRRGRANIDNALRSQLNPAQEGSAKITVDVNAPKGTRVGAEADGLFRDVQINRATQMTPAAQGPAESFGP